MCNSPFTLTTRTSRVGAEYIVEVDASSRARNFSFRAFYIIRRIATI